MATRRTAQKKVAAVNAPQSREEADAQLNHIGVLTRLIEEAGRKADEHKAAIDKGLAETLAPYAAELEELRNGLFAWASANRDELTNGNRTKTVKLASGEVSWAWTPLKVTVRNAEKVLASIETLGLAAKFIRTKKEVNKEAMVSPGNRDLAQSIEGVTLSRAELFSIKPNETEAAILDVGRLAKATGIDPGTPTGSDAA